jgi:hypothetical protein
MSSNLAKIQQLDLGSLSIGDLSNVKNSILRNALIEINELEERDFELQSHQNHVSHGSHTTHENAPVPVQPPDSEVTYDIPS